MNSRQPIAVALLTLVAALAGAQQAPRGVRITGTVKSVTADKLVLTTAKGDVAIAITTQTRVLVSRPASARDIKPGAYLGTANQNGAADTGTATEIHLANDGPNVNCPMNDSGLTMTNGHVKRVHRTSSGEELDIDYGKSTTRHVVVPAQTPVTRMVTVGKDALKTNVSVNAMTTTGADGSPVATFILLGPPRR
jgi:hypothetical protein